ncbi:MAG: cell division protein FtsX [Halocynthiibacter sp.]
MMTRLQPFLALIKGDAAADRVVPPKGFSAQMTLWAAAAMAFLAVFALAVSFTTGRMATYWGSVLAQSTTVRISAPESQRDAQTLLAVRVLETTPGVKTVRVVPKDEQVKLLEPWFGPDLAVDALPLPQLIEVLETKEGYDAEALRLRLSAEAPGAIVDDHNRWRKPLVTSAKRIRMFGLLSVALIFGVLVVMVIFASNAALAANTKVLSVLRLIGARDTYIARAFVRRFTTRAFWGAVIGVGLGALMLLLMPLSSGASEFGTAIGFQGWEWLWLLFVPVISALSAFFATRMSALNTLKGHR